MGKIERELYKKEIIREFKEGVNISNIALNLKINRLDVKKVLMAEGMYQETRKYIEKDDNSKNKIISLYKSGKTLKEISKLVKYGEQTVSSVIKESDTKMKSAGFYNRKYTVDDNCFSEYTPESVYWAGFIAGDGCVYSHGLADKTINNYLTIGLATIDKEHLEKFKQFTKYSGVLYNRDNSVSITINSKKIVDDLKSKYNITNLKTNTYLPPSEIPNELIKYFILGLFDSDGCISKSVRPNRKAKHIKGNHIFQMNFTGTKETCEYFKKFFSSNVKLSKRNNNNSNNYTVAIQGNLQIVKYLNMLYDEKSTVFSLSRKLSKFYELIKQYNI